MSSEPNEIIQNVNTTNSLIDATYVGFKEGSSSNFSNLTTLIEQLKQKAQSSSRVDQAMVDQVRASLEPIYKSVQEATKMHKEVFNTVNKCQKNTRKIFPDDIHKISSGVFEGGAPRTILHQLLIKHLLMLGKADLAHVLSREFNIDFDDTVLHKYGQVNRISWDLLHQDSASLIKWIHENSANLEKVDSKLYFLLVKLELTELLFQNRIRDFMNRSKEAFQEGSVREELCSHVKKLLSILINAKAGYDSGLIDEIWRDLNQEFFRTTNLILQGSSESLLLPILQVGMRAMEPLLNFARQYENARVMKYEGSTLPVDLKLHYGFQHHSMYICPVLKEPCTVDNPPMRMKCGHLISRNGMQSILVNDRHSIKCPYCPVTSKKTDMLGIQM